MAYCGVSPYSVNMDQQQMPQMYQDLQLSSPLWTTPTNRTGANHTQQQQQQPMLLLMPPLSMSHGNCGPMSPMSPMSPVSPLMSSPVSPGSEYYPGSPARYGRSFTGDMSEASPPSRSSKGPISKLQEFVQSSKAHPLPSSCAVLQWSHENRMSGSSLQFRATTSFLLDGVPHHVLGGWWPSKKHSQRDAAERALTFFTAIYGHELGRESTPSARTPCEGSRSDPVKDLEQLVGEAIWSIQAENGLSTATVEFAYFNVPHAFTGKPCAVEAAKADTAKRVLWYLRCPGYQNTYEMEPEQVKTLAFNIPEVCVPPAAGPEPSEDSECCSPTSPSELLERKTTVMRLQNRLQKIFAKQLTSGKSVWCWRYEKNEEDSFQASVHIALLDRTFTGTWESTHQAAQMEACNQLTAYLDKEGLKF